MKIKVLFCFIVSILLAVVCLTLLRKPMNENSQCFTAPLKSLSFTTNVLGITLDFHSNTTPFAIPSRAERVKMGNINRIMMLEKLGYVPDDADWTDYDLAEQTSWWGKKLDPEKFWEGRAVWHDKSAQFEAQRRERYYPPMPYEDISLANYDDNDMKKDLDEFALREWQPNFKSSDRERAFWVKFWKTHPHPPEDIQRWLNDKANSWMQTKYYLENDLEMVKLLRINSRELTTDITSALRDTKNLGYPPECISPEAYFWEHVMKKRIEYEKFLTYKWSKQPMEIKFFFEKVYVDRILITEPLTQEQIDAANAWKVKYLNRLRSEQWDESYINAYLQAWDLTEEYVFGENEGKK